MNLDPSFVSDCQPYLGHSVSTLIPQRPRWSLTVDVVTLQTENKTLSLPTDLIMIATGQGKVRAIQGQGKVREFCTGSGKLEVLRKVREIQENPLKVREI